MANIAIHHSDLSKLIGIQKAGARGIKKIWGGESKKTGALLCSPFFIAPAFAAAYDGWSMQLILGNETLDTDLALYDIGFLNSSLLGLLSWSTTNWFQTTDNILPQFWRLEVQNQNIGRAMLFLLACMGCWQSLIFICLQLHNSNSCLTILIIFPLCVCVFIWWSPFCLYLSLSFFCKFKS